MNDDEIKEVLELDKLARDFAQAFVIAGLPLDPRAKLMVELAYAAGYKKAKEELNAKL